MEENKYRGVGILMLCLLLAAAGIWNFENGSLKVSTGAEGRSMPVCSVNTTEKKVALTFDTAGKGEDVDEILRILEECGVKAAFFVTGSWAESFPMEVTKIAEEGHDLGNLGEGKRRMGTLSRKECREELQSVQRKVKELTGKEMELFRPPYGDYSNELLETAKEFGYTSVLWSVDSRDWKDYGKEDIVKTVTENKSLNSGAIILCHTGTKYTAQALEMIIKEIQAKGFGFVPLSELLYL